MFALADEYLRRGAVRNAVAIYSLLSRDPNADVRNEARFRLAKILAAAGETARAALLLRRILDDRPSAAPVRLQLAGLLDKMGDKEGAWRQLRAARAGGLPSAVARIVDRYSEALRSERPFGASIEIAVAPDSNINSATRSDTLGTVLGDFDIAESSKAKSGTGLSLHPQFYRRLPLNGGIDSLLIRLSGFANLYRHKQFNDVAADLAAGPELVIGRNRLQLELGGTQRWFGQKPYMRSARVAGTFSRPLGSRTLLRLNGSAALVDNQINDLEDGKRYSGQFSVEHALNPETGIAPTFSFDRQSLRDPGYSSTGWRVGLTGWRDVGRMTLTADVEIGRLKADQRLSLFPRKRSDRYSRIGVGATFRQLEFRGFAPIARLSLERNGSSIAFYDYRRTRTEFGVVRAF
jgi:hypothetical protein